jgi:hypothetical protein
VKSVREEEGILTVSYLLAFFSPSHLSEASHCLSKKTIDLPPLVGIIVPGLKLSMYPEHLFIV